jgi:hypothetical protein
MAHLPYGIWDHVARHSGGSTAADTLASIRTAIASLGWSVEHSVTGFTDMIACKPPNSGGGADVQDLRVCFMAASGALTRQMLTPDTYTANNLHCAVAKGITTEELGDGVATGNPFGGGVFSGWWRTALNLNLERFLVVAATEEILHVSLDADGTPNVHSAQAGAIINTYSNRFTEANGRSYGMVTGLNVKNATWLGGPFATTGWLVHGTANGNAHFGMFEPGGSGWLTLARWTNLAHAPSASKANPAGEVVGNSIPVALFSDNTNTPIGKLRSIYYWRDGHHGEVRKDDPVGTPASPSDSSNWEDGVLLIGHQNNAEGDTVALPLKDLRA